MWWQTIGATAAIIGLAEIGDKSQLVCMALAAKHKRIKPVLLGSIIAFSILNALAVIFGGAVANWLPREWILAGAAILFSVFGIKTFFEKDVEDDNIEETKTSSLFLTTFLMIFLAELGDKTQIATAGLASMYPALYVWTGATIALASTSFLGAVTGKTILTKLPIVWLHKFAGILFLGMAVYAGWSFIKLVGFI
ncbi:TMEM165/GDT1 family protein [Pseudemcibacter aquimaris]|uniref:TMEM165/GDT1 family protein n=1 Tax=Pseudemcibacter aquimaris TaxID=2857064 RepID=UPI00201337FA|nr:TMEM165/GDT1 family protein [Pseudemcibacter aquimaris]MCC3861780.1 TMEM165/GDT1 family protein [Pseudemcibacter aquimaris]WDU57893.1 TMEM165/GDT1 family protein [Pseudemcibacter aquimaris]